jgi:shikimate kinase
MKAPNNIFLVGPMGAGKSTIGRRLANMLAMEFYDSDHEIEKRTGADIPLIFEIEGEEGFRKREKAVIDELSCKSGVVLATGGGAILDESNRQRLSERGVIVYLRTSVSQQLMRTRHDQNRPLLQTENPKEKLRELMEIRDPLYQGIAQVTVDTDGRSILSVANEIIKKLDLRPPAAGG